MNNILLGLFFLILGLLFANMLTNICGCRDLIEGQCTNFGNNNSPPPTDCVPNGSLTCINNMEDFNTLYQDQNKQIQAEGICTGEGGQDIIQDFVDFMNDRENEENRLLKSQFLSNWRNDCCEWSTPTTIPLSQPSSGNYILNCVDNQLTFTAH